MDDLLFWVHLREYLTSFAAGVLYKHRLTLAVCVCQMDTKIQPHVHTPSTHTSMVAGI